MVVETKTTKPDKQVSIQTPEEEAPVPVTHDVEHGVSRPSHSDSFLNQLLPAPAAPTASILSRPSGHHHEDGDDNRRISAMPTPRQVSNFVPDETAPPVITPPTASPGPSQPAVRQRRGHHPQHTQRRQAGLRAPQPPTNNSSNFGGYHGLNRSMANLTRHYKARTVSSEAGSTGGNSTNPIVATTDTTTEATTSTAVPDYNTYLQAQRMMSTKRHMLQSNRYLPHHHHHHHNPHHDTFQDPQAGEGDYLDPLEEGREESSARPNDSNNNNKGRRSGSSSTGFGSDRQRISSVLQAMGGRLSYLRDSAIRSYINLHAHEEEHPPSHHAHIPLYCHPVQRQRWDDDQVLPHINWGDIFFDLFYVAAAYNLGVLLISSMNPEDWKRGIVYFLGIFGPLYNTWENDLYYSSRYTVIDHFHRIWEVIRYVLVAAIILHIKTLNFLADASSFETFALMISLFLESVMQMILNLEVAFLGEGDRTAIKRHTLGKIRHIFLPNALVYGAAAAIAGVSLYDKNNTATAAAHRSLATASDATVASVLGDNWVLADAPYLLCLGIYVLQLIGVAFYSIKLAHSSKDIREHFVPNNVDYLIHRYGEWVMLMIGESVLSLLIVETIESQDYYIIALVGVLTVIIIQTLKFESEPAHLDGHALWRSMKASIAYSTLIQILSVSLISFGVSYKVMLTLAQSEAAYKEAAEAACSGGDSKVRGLAVSFDTDVDCKEGAKRLLAALPVITDHAAAALYCGSLTLVLIALELMATTHHNGFRISWQFLFKDEDDESAGGRWRLSWPMLTLSTFKLSFIGFLATLPLWQSDPRSIASAGFLVVVGMFCARVIGWGIFHKEDEIREFLGMSTIVNSKVAAETTHALDSIYASTPPVESDYNGEDNNTQEDSIRVRARLEKAVWDCSFDAIVVIDSTGTIKHVNDTTLQMFGYPDAKELVGNNVSVLVGGGAARNHASYVMKFGLGDKTNSIIGKQRALHSRRKDGSEFPCVIGIKKLPGSTDMVGYIRDSTGLP